uniref:Translation initiation factor 1 n=1 Tax=Dunnia sinensis TaxID=187337 RepID=A0A6M3W2B6_9GENT|nr:translation initiation factor 1 [Dunnia sinensis]
MFRVRLDTEDLILGVMFQESFDVVFYRYCQEIE